MNVTIKKTERILDDLFKVDRATLQYEKFNGEMSAELTRLNFVRGHSAALLIYNADSNSIILSRQFRYPSYAVDNEKGWLWEIIAGTIERGESALQSIQREALEEAGYRIRDPEYVYEFFVSPGGSSEKITLYFAEVEARNRIGSGGGEAIEGEDLEIREVPIPEAMQMMATGEICDAKTIIALQWFANRAAVKKQWA
ncbi:NUDIX hydrolase [candidate division KSB1 bacterium]|nr:NUDIX hydrolase [candidate division KSB1 bacterium]